MPKPSARKATKDRPVHTVRHRKIAAAIWKNETDNGPHYSVTVKRSYKDKDGQWHDTQIFGFDDLLTVAKALTDCHTMISTAMGRDRAQCRSSESVT